MPGYSMNNPNTKDIDNDILIEEVKSRPALYDRSLKEYSDMTYKKKMWEEIYEKLFPDTWDQMTETQRDLKGSDVNKRWNNLRTCFTRELKIMKDPLTHKRRKYIYFDKLLFLVEENSLQLNEAQEIERNFVLTRSNSSLDRLDDDTTSDKSPVEKPKSRENKKKTKGKSKNKDVGKYVQYSLNKFKEELGLKNRNEVQIESAGRSFDADADTNFALSLVPTLKMVPTSKKIDAQIEILSVLKKYTKNVPCDFSVVKFENEDEQVTEGDEDDSDNASLFNEDI